MDRWASTEGSAFPLGASWIAEEQVWNFALYSKHATGVTLLLFADRDLVHAVYEYTMDYLTNKSGRVWHCRVPVAAIKDARYYGYRVEGPFEPEDGQRFDPQKILLDPYARSVFFPKDFSREAARHPGSNVGKAPLGIIQCGCLEPVPGPDRQPHHTSDTIIYELHVRGFTMRPNSGVKPERRGTYLGLLDKIPYLKELGVTAVELLPIHQFDPQEGTYWGHMPVNFFSVHHAYATNPQACEQMMEFQTLVQALHEADIEVILDVTYNHTAEADEDGPTYSYRGIDNTTYYLLEDDRSKYRNDTGCGNTLHCANRYVRKMIIDSMLFWVREMHVDGFRFDLASIFTRNSDGSINLHDPPIISEISSLAEFASVRLIAEAWDVSSYQVGRSFPGMMWFQWNGKFRDDVRAFVRGDEGKVPALMTRLYGSNDLFPDDLPDAYHAYQGVNFVTSHDGFCMYDLVSYDTKHNEANGLHNTDGTDFNVSWNCGWEGDDGVPPAVLALRKRQIKNFCCLLFLANGTPMFCAGDEFMNTQRGNNNPYNQDNETTWVNWDLLNQHSDIFRFFKEMIRFRKAHPSLCRSRFWRNDVRWYGVGPEADLSWFSHSLAFCLHGTSQQDSDLYVMINAYWEKLDFVIQEGQAAEWWRVVDTSMSSPEDFCEPGRERRLLTSSYAVQPRSVVILSRKRLRKTF
jgi:isoamylase